MPIAKELVPLRRGTTDSEYAFLWLMSRLFENGSATKTGCADFGLLINSVAESIAWLAQQCDALVVEKPAKLNFILTDGQHLIASRWGNSLHYATRVGIHDCEICGIPHVHHHPGFDYRAVVVASEPVSHTEKWQEVPDRSLLSLDRELRLDIQPIAVAPFGTEAMVT